MRRMTRTLPSPSRHAATSLPDEVASWRFLEATTHDVFSRYGFSEIRTPIFESTELFARSVGAATDIVRKEMYTFDAGDESITLRPENTAPVVRAFVEHALHRTIAAGFPERFYYLGPMFRHERPQKGRQRQFHQIGAEVLGSRRASRPTPRRSRWSGRCSTRWASHDRELRLNTVGDAACRPRYREALDDVARAAASRDVRRLPAAGGREPAAGVRLQGRGGSQAARGGTRHDRQPLRALRRPLRRGARHPRRLRDPVRRRSAPRARPRLLPAHRLRGRGDGSRRAERASGRRALRRTRRRARRARRFPVSDSPRGWSGSCSSMGKALRRGFASDLLLVALGDAGFSRLGRARAATARARAARRDAADASGRWAPR